MKEIIDKISSYNIFNYLLPGILMVAMAKQFTTHHFLESNNLIINAFILYFIGIVVSRFGSLIIEPFLKFIQFVKVADYTKFVIASSKDNKIELFVEVANQYRTLFSMLILILLLKLYEFIEIKFSISNTTTNYIGIVLLLIIFLFSYRKQSNYITKRVEANP